MYLPARMCAIITDTMTVDTILIVEDEAELAKLYCHWLGQRYSVRVAHDTTEALRQFDSNVEIVLLDRTLPDGRGEDLIPAFRRRNSDVLIGWVTSQDPEPGVVEKSFDAYEVKPVREDDILGFVEQLRQQGQLYDSACD